MTLEEAIAVMASYSRADFANYNYPESIETWGEANSIGFQALADLADVYGNWTDKSWVLRARQRLLNSSFCGDAMYTTPFGVSFYAVNRRQGGAFGLPGGATAASGVVWSEVTRSQYGVDVSAQPQLVKDLLEAAGASGNYYGVDFAIARAAFSVTERKGATISKTVTYPNYHTLAQWVLVEDNAGAPVYSNDAEISVPENVWTFHVTERSESWDWWGVGGGVGASILVALPVTVMGQWKVEMEAAPHSFFVGGPGEW